MWEYKIYQKAEEQNNGSRIRMCVVFPPESVQLALDYWRSVEFFLMEFMRGTGIVGVVT
jgi:hypothetical protein